MVLFRTNYQGYRIEIVNDLVGDGFIGVAGEALSDEYQVQRVRIEGESLPYVLWNVIDAVDRGF